MGSNEMVNDGEEEDALMRRCISFEFRMPVY